ncbi:MAG: hypothetical protein AAGF96_00645 [Bacteroidota bacterium]
MAISAYALSSPYNLIFIEALFIYNYLNIIYLNLFVIKDVMSVSILLSNDVPTSRLYFVHGQHLVRTRLADNLAPTNCLEYKEWDFVYFYDFGASVLSNTTN